MEKFTQRQIKWLVKTYAAIEIKDDKDTFKMLLPVKVIGFSKGEYGTNGLLMLDSTGTLFAITSRASVLFLFI